MSRKPEIIRVLHLDDDPFELERTEKSLATHDLDCIFDVRTATTKAEFERKLRDRNDMDIVILDIHLDDDEQTTGIDLVGIAHRLAPKAVVLMCSASDDVKTVIECLNTGADDFISKQSDQGEFALRVYNAKRLTQLKRGAVTDSPAIAKIKGREPIGKTMQGIGRRVPLVMDSAITSVFISGESGTGKEVVADLFAGSTPPGTPFVKVNCGAIAPSLLESELFGHVKGAFTGAAQDKRGLFEAAHGGWIFLDEVATLSRSAQVALLRVLENQEVIRVGSTKPSKINVRVLSATNEPLAERVEKDEFRGDLWQRLRETEIVLPPLRERPDEIPELVNFFCRDMVGGPYQVSGPVMDVLRVVPWRRGNIRELRNCLRAMTEMHVDKLLTPLAIPSRIWDELGEKPDASGTATVGGAADGELRLPFSTVNPANYEHMTDLLLLNMTKSLAQAKGKMSLRGLAQLIGMSRSTLSGRLKALVHRDVIALGELAKMVGVSEK